MHTEMIVGYFDCILISCEAFSTQSILKDQFTKRKRIRDVRTENTTKHSCEAKGQRIFDLQVKVVIPSLQVILSEMLHKLHAAML